MTAAAARSAIASVAANVRNVIENIVSSATKPFIELLNINKNVIVTQPLTDRPSVTMPSRCKRQGKDDLGRWASLPSVIEELAVKHQKLMATKFPRRRNADVPALLKHHGVYIPSPGAASWAEGTESMTTAFGKELPSFAFLSLPETDRDRGINGEENILSDWVCLVKYERGGCPGVEMPPSGSQLYEIGFGCAKSDKAPSFWVAAGYVAVLPDGSIRAMRFLSDNSKEFRGKKDWVRVPSRSWTFGVCSQEHLKNLFSWMINTYAKREAGWNVSVEKDGLRLSFTIPDNDAPYFFRSRKKDGNRIFHAVAAHSRRLKSGKTSYVKTHYRGSRHFNWQGFRVAVQIPGLHRPSFLGMTFGASERLEKTANTISLADAAPRLSNVSWR